MNRKTKKQTSKPAGPQPCLRHLEASPLAQQHGGGGHPHVGEAHLAVSVRRIVVAEDGQRAHNSQPRALHWHEQHRMNTVRADLAPVHHPAQHQAEAAARVTRPAHPPLAPVQPVARLSAGPLCFLDAQRHARRVRRGDVRLGHGVAAADVAGEQRREPACLLLEVAEAYEQLHIARVRGCVCVGIRIRIRIGIRFCIRIRIRIRIIA